MQRSWRKAVWAAVAMGAQWLCAPALAAEAVKVALLAESQPFHTWPVGGPPRGYDVDLLARLARDTGLKFEYRRYERWDLVLKASTRPPCRACSSASRAAAVSSACWWSKTRRCMACC